MDIHLRERLLHVLHMPCLAAQRAYVVGRTKRAAQQAVAHELLQPLAVQHVGLAARDILDMPCVDQQNGEATVKVAMPRASSSSYKGIQYTPVDSIATVSTPPASRPDD